MTTRLGWLTDMHLDFVDEAKRGALWRRLAALELDGLLVTGDIGQATSLEGFLEEMTESLGACPIYFVLGNHDYYHGSIAGVREALPGFCARHPKLVWLGGLEAAMLVGEETALVGHGGWGDGRLGDPEGTGVMLNDFRLIDELRLVNRGRLIAALRALGDEAAERLEARLERALARRRRVLVLTHVPPFAESCWHEGRLSDDAWLPWFSCHAVGEVLVRVAERNPEAQLMVLCGHTHSAGDAWPRPNLWVRTGGAEYGAPRLQAVLALP